jgi:SAM-dependent methyltransferase
MTQTYVFDNAWQRERHRLDALETIWGPWTVRNLEAIGVGDGWRCAEVGAGGGSVARWLAERAGPSGQVVATDLDTRLLEEIDAPNLEVRRHDITADWLEPGAYDLVHCRLLLEHLPRHEEALERMRAALKPGGWLVVEEFDHTTFRPDPACSEADRAVWDAWLAAFEQLSRERGLDLAYGSRLFGLLSRLGLEAVAAEGYLVCEHGGVAERALLLLSVLKLRTDLTATGEIDGRGVDRLVALLQDPAFFWTSQLMVTARGRRPA